MKEIKFNMPNGKSPISCTEAQGRVMKFILRYASKAGFPPTLEEISREMEFSSTNSARCHLNALEKRGAIKLIPRTARGIKVLVQTP